MEKILIVHRYGDGNTLNEEDVTNRVMEDPEKIAQVINVISNEIADYNNRQVSFQEKGLIDKPKVKILITN